MPTSRREDGYSSRKYGGRGRSDVKVRQLRSEDARLSHEASDVALAYLSALTYLLVRESTPMYIGAPTNAGTRKIRVYLPDEAVETYLSADENPSDVIGELMEAVLGAQLERELHELAADWLAQRPAVAPPAAKPGRKSGRGAIVAPEPSQEP